MEKQILQHVINGCQIEILNYKCDYVGIQYAKANGHYFIGKELYVTYEGGHTGKSTNEFKLILLGLDNLTKEIEVSGEKFIPVNVIGEDVDFNICRADYVTDWDEKGGDFLVYVDEFIKRVHDNHHLDFLPFGFVTKLLEWHFDIYGLIEKGLAISIHDVK